MTLTNGFKHKTNVDVRFHDLDALGHVNNARYLNYLEQARLTYAKEILGWDGTLQTLSLIIAKVTIDYTHPIHLGDTLALWTRVSRLGNKSFDLEYLFVVTPHDGEPTLSATAKTTVVTFDYTENKTVPIYTAWREAMLAYEPQLIG